MRPFEYVTVEDSANAIAAVAGSDDARFVAGGTNLVDLMKLGVETPATLVDVSRLPLGGIEQLPGGGVRIGAGVRNSELAGARVIRERYPVLAQALLAGASGQLRNQATVGGNLLQRTRCAYFTDVSKPCNKRRPGSGCPARAGAHRELAVIGTSPQCVASNPSDMNVALAALDAEVDVIGRTGTRTIPISELHRLPGDHPERDHVLAPTDLITAVRLPDSAVARRSSYRKVRDRASYAFALVSVAAALDVDDGTVVDVRVALGQVAPKPWRLTGVEDALRGGPASPEAFAEAAGHALDDADPLPESAFKVPLARKLVARALTDLARES